MKEFLIWFLVLVIPATGQGPSGGAQDNPGTRFSFRAKGTDALAMSLGKMIDTEIAKVTLIKANIPLALVQDGLFAVQQVRLSKYTPAVSHSINAVAPNLFQWVSRDFGFVSQGSFSTTFFQLGSGSFTAQSTKAAVDVKITVEPSGNQKPYLTVSNCTAIAKDAQLDVSLDGLLGTLLSLYKDNIQKQKVRIVEQLICETVAYYVRNVINEMIRLSIFNASLIDSSKDYPQLTSDLVYNYGLIKPATVTSKGYHVDVSGETSWRNQGGTPFNPAVLDTSISTDNMLDVYVTDYTFNSMFYHAYSHKLFDATFGDTKSPNFKPALQLSCSAKQQCFGSVFPELSKRYPGQSAQMEMSLSSAPYVIFAKNQNSSFFMNSTLNFSAKAKGGKMETFLAANSRWEGNLNFDFNKNNAIISSINIKIMELKLIQTLLNSTNQKVLNSLSDVIRPILEKEINRKLAKGYTITDNPYGNLVKPTVQYTDRTMLISTGFTIDDKYLLKIASQARLNVQNAR